MRKKFFLTISILSIVVICLLTGSRTAPAVSIEETALPKTPGFAGWHRLGEHYSYTPKTLYKYINGAADLFISYGFIKLSGAEYAFGESNKETMIVDMYDMQNRLNAFGIFQSKKDPETGTFKIGTDGFGNEEYVFFYKNRYYVEIQVFGPANPQREVHRQLAKKIAETLPGDTRAPVELRYLPDADLVDGAKTYITGGILGHAFLDKGFTGKYRLGEETVKAFISFFPSPGEAAAAVKKYKEYLQGAGEQCLPLKGFGDEGFASRERYYKNVLVARQDTFIFGVTNLSNSDSGKPLLKRLIEQINNK